MNFRRILLPFLLNKLVFADSKNKKSGSGFKGMLDTGKNMLKEKGKEEFAKKSTAQIDEEQNVSLPGLK